MATNMRGLTMFVSDVRNCQNKESEDKRVAKELANIRAKFTASKPLSAYDRKKYVWKLVYILILGYEVEFGHVEVINLISASSYQEKLVGYLAASVLLKNTDSQITLVVQSIRNDLTSPRDEVQCLALSAISNIGGPALAESLSPDVQRLLTGKATFPIVRKKAALTLLRLFRVNRELVPTVEWAPKVVALMDDPSLSVVMSVVTLMLGMCAFNSSGYEKSIPAAITTLGRLAINNSCTSDYLYYHTANPWMQVKLLQLLQMFPAPSETALRTKLSEILKKIISHTEVTKSVNKNNGDHAILFEAMNLVIKYGNSFEKTLHDPAVKLLSRYISVREPNIRYLGLDTMARLAAIETTRAEIRKHQATILYSLKDSDISIRKRALDLLFAMADRSNAMDVVKELLNYLGVADFNIKQEMVLKLAILAERYAPNYRWYVDTLLKMIEVAGDYVGDEIWHRTVQIVTNQADLQKYAAHKMYETVKDPKAHEAAVKVAGYTLGEFGFLLNEAEEDGDSSHDAPPVSGAEQFAALHQHFKRVGSDTKALLLSAFVKFQNLYPELSEAVRGVFTAHTTVMDAELQQRAVEYLALPSIGEEAVGVVLDSMPPFPERESALESMLRSKDAKAPDESVNVWKEETKGKKKSDDAEEEDEGSDSGSEVGAPEDAAASPTPEERAPSPDLLGLGDEPPKKAPTKVGSGSGSGAGERRTISVEPGQAAQVAAWRNAFVKANSGVVFENDFVQVGLQYQARPPDVRCMLHLRNKTGGPLKSLKVRVPATAALKTAFIDAVPGEIPASGAVKAQVAVKSMQPFSENPALQISFLSDALTGHAYALKFPMFATHFVDPVAMAEADFAARWGKLAGKANEAVAIVTAYAGQTASAPAAAAALKAARIGAVTRAAPSPTPTEIGAGSFRTGTMNAAGAPISVGLLVRVDANPSVNAYRIIVRSQHGAVAAGVLAALAPQLGTGAP